MPIKPNIVILNTGCANLTSVEFALKRLGYTPVISDEPSVVKRADKVLLPGVGTAKAAMAELAGRNLISLVQSLTQPVLGICLGMQLLTSFSEETQGVALLDLIQAQTQLMKPNELPIPHCGWNTLSAHTNHPLFEGISKDAYFYFVHSYSVPVGEYTLATTEYGGAFSAAIAHDNFTGVQFHPERSGQAGAKLLKNFIEM
ncbi:imidazole glycerol phosphate synthase subunit HisH [Thorsellia anophelis]|uniref:Imidazole glycerol phosphate synthase subunit HisH n=1 Tax=Thorsellia anophelis DSM 18579 TaxID=1123402 RepID=A0A1I0B2V9_9GAMM|nr:imidazole glycerol phosphate synthase subunit HisH [Thorsellia anophelis]SET00409.1 glutamine amidotransferase [Thorsellia anophelis DSM 18579]